MSGTSLISTSDLTKPEILKIFSRALEFKKGANTTVPDPGVFLCFLEHSTRTRFSFERALQLLGWRYSQFDFDASSSAKGESMDDTFETLEAHGFQVGIARVSEPDFFQRIKPGHLRWINAGAGAWEHPTQALLDAFTMWERWKDLSGKTVAILGDIQHSRVAHSNINLLPKCGAQVIVCGPPAWVSPRWNDVPGVQVVSTREVALEQADAVMALRCQLERHVDGVGISKAEFFRLYGVTQSHLMGLKKQPLLLSPGPIMWGAELDENVRTYKNNLIVTQIQNSVFIRMAVLESVGAA